MKKFSVIILADCENSLMNSKCPTAAQKICGKEMLLYVIKAANEAGANKIVTVINEDDAAVKDLVLDNVTSDYSEAINLIEDDYAVILKANMPLIKAETIKSAVLNHIESDNGITLVTELDYEYNSGICVADRKKLSDIDTDDYLPFYVSDINELYEVNNKLELSEAENIMKERINEKHMLNGVTIHSPETVMISDDVVIGSDTEIFPDVVIEKGSIIGEDVIITAGSKISNSKIFDGVSIQTSVILDSEIHENTTVGPFAYVRPNCVVGKNARIGDFVELKNTNIGNGTKVSHLTYVGDSDVGEKCNFGCGTVTVNYDGKKKYRTVIGNNVFVGCNSNLVAPVTLKDGAYTAAGSTITDEVPEDTLAIARARQVNKENWNDRRK